MSELASDPLEDILRQCDAVKPDPWYPREYSEKTGIPPASLDPYLDRLRLGGLIRLTDWVQGKGQGYVLTTEGLRVLGSSWALSRLRSGQVTAAREETAAAPAEKRGGLTTYDRGEIIRHALLAPATPYMTRLLFWANVMVFLVGLMWAEQQQQLNQYLTVGTPTILHNLGALRGGDLGRGEWWRLLSCCFVHFGFMHIAMNMLGLYVVGPLVERMWGHWRFLAIYLISGLVGACAMSFTLIVPEQMGAGASGALWGMMTSMAVWVVLNRRFLPRQLVSSWLSQLTMLLILNVFISMMPGISAAGHFGGGIGGVVAGVLLNYQRFGKSSLLRWVALLGVVLLPVASVTGLPQARVWYREILARNPNLLTAGQRAAFDAQERADLEASVLPQVGRLEREARRLYEKTAEDVLIQRAARRDPKQVEEALGALGEAQEKLREAAGVLNGPGRYVTPELEDARNTRRIHIEEQIKLNDLREQKLRQGPNWTEADEKALEEQTERVKEAARRWRALLK
jgi:membrane associated rhomboid family serine protease